MLGVVLEKQGKKGQAVDCYERALHMQPTLWCAFEKLCKLAGGPASDERVDAAKFFTSTNLDIQQMNSMIKEHMHIQQYNHQMGVVVNNFDQSPATGADNDTLRYEAFNAKTGGKQFATNQKTPLPSKKEMKENLQSSSAAVSQNSHPGRMMQAPQKPQPQQQSEEMSSGSPPKQSDHIRDIDNKFTNEFHGEIEQSKLKTPTQNFLQTYVTPGGGTQLRKNAPS